MLQVSRVHAQCCFGWQWCPHALLLVAASIASRAAGLSSLAGLASVSHQFSSSSTLTADAAVQFPGLDLEGRRRQHTIALRADRSSRSTSGTASTDKNATLASNSSGGQAGVGQPLYAFTGIQLPRNRTDRHCITLRMDKTTHALAVDPGEPDINSIAWGCFNDAINATGWSMLSITTTDESNIPIGVRAYAAGIVEGLLTMQRIDQFITNVRAVMLMDVLNDTTLAIETERVIQQSLAAWEAMAGVSPDVMPSNDLDRQAWAALLQFKGIKDGYDLLVHREQSGRERSVYDFMLVNMHAELPSVMELWGRYAKGCRHDCIFNETANISFTGNFTMDDYIAKCKDEKTGSTLGPFCSIQWSRWSSHRAKGTAYARRLGPKDAPEDLLTGHVAFGEYSSMTRIMKRYHLNFGTMVTDMTLSSYPGCISSTDDYFQTNRGFVLMSTSLYVPSRGPYAVPHLSKGAGVPAFLRATIATRLATLPRMWAHIYGFIPGVAAAKQWLLVDFSRMKEQQPLGNDTVWLIESMPSMQRAADVTHLLREQGYVEAHGVPHFRQIREIFGLSPLMPGSYEEQQRSALVDQAMTVSNLADARGLLRSVEPSRGSGQIPISARYDLSKYRPVPAGGIDAKVASKCLVEAFSFQCVSGPPVPVSGEIFNWSSSASTVASWPHRGQPESWNFDWVSIGGQEGRIHYPLNPNDAECEPAALAAGAHLR